jgi:putative glutamine amidotransferase
MHSKRPKIGITLSETGGADTYRWPSRRRFDYIKREYYEAILVADGIPVLLANTDPPSALDVIVDELHGILLTGGGDLHPQFYNQAPLNEIADPTTTRDNFEMALISRVLERNLPILAICRGHQMLNVALGGTLSQDLSCLPFKAQPHADPQQTGKIFHDVTIDPESRLFAVIGEEMIQTNSSHHQVVDRLGQGLKAVAFAPDGVIEAIEHTGREFVIGVQWHPEGIAEREHSRKLFRSLVENARQII